MQVGPPLPGTSPARIVSNRKKYPVCGAVLFLFAKPLKLRTGVSGSYHIATTAAAINWGSKFGLAS